MPEKNRHYCGSCDEVHGCHCKFIQCARCRVFDCPVTHRCAPTGYGQQTILNLGVGHRTRSEESPRFGATDYAEDWS